MLCGKDEEGTTMSRGSTPVMTSEYMDEADFDKYKKLYQEFQESSGLFGGNFGENYDAIEKICKLPSGHNWILSGLVVSCSSCSQKIYLIRGYSILYWMPLLFKTGLVPCSVAVMKKALL